MPGSPPDLQIFGHRGAIVTSAPFYQNSLGAFREAVETCDGFETDACIDKDGEVFLIHEAKYVDPAKGVEYCASEHVDSASAGFIGQRRIDELTTGDMRQLRLKDGTPIPTLRQAIELVGSRGKILNIELKAYEVVKPVLRLVKDAIGKRMAAPRSFILSSFNHPALEIVRRDMPELPVGALFNYPDAPEKPIFPWRPGSDAAYVPLGDNGLGSEVLKRVQADYIIMPQEIMTIENFAMIGAHYPKAKCAGWIFTEKGNFNMAEFKSRLGRLRATGKLAAMMVDNPREFAKAIRA